MGSQKCEKPWEMCGLCGSGLSVGHCSIQLSYRRLGEQLLQYRDASAGCQFPGRVKGLKINSIHELQ
jgi:hypothetical protein